MVKEPIFSICIPTYNQPDSIRAFFESAGSQLSEEVEVLIRDDSPDDRTAKVVEEYSPKVPASVHYFKGEKSKVGGYDRALLFLTQNAKGKYLWWYGDDVMAPNSVNRLIELDKKHPGLVFIWLNSRDINRPEDRGLDLGGDRYFKNGGEIFSINVGLLGFPSATILRREKAMEAFDGAHKFIGTTLTGYYLVLHVITEASGEMVFLQEPCLLSHPKPHGEARWYDSFVVHGVNYNIIAQDFKDKLGRKSLRRGLADQFGRVWRAVIVERALGYKTGFGAPTPKMCKMAKLYWSYPEFWIALPLFLIPRPILGMLYRIYKKVK